MEVIDIPRDNASSCLTVSLPRPMLPPVTMMTLADKSGMSEEGVKRILVHEIARQGS